MRIGIAGAGIAGLAVAWLLEDDHECVVLESRDRIGGHARSVPIWLNGKQVSIELGSQDISADVFPLHRRLLELLGYPGEQIRPIPASLSVRRSGAVEPFLVTPADGPTEHPRSTVLGPAWEALGCFLEHALDRYESGDDWDVPLADLVEPLPVPDDLKRDLLYARPASLFCCDIEQVKELSARVATHFYVAASGEARWQQLASGLESSAWALAAGSPRARIKTGAALREARRAGERFELADAAGERHTVDRLVLAVPPPAAGDLLAPLAGTGDLRAAMASFRPVRAAYALHLDPLYMPPDPAHWASSNLVTDGVSCETSDWLGPVHGVDVFKSQIVKRDRLPRRLLHRADFQHFLITPATVRARRRLESAQGAGGLYFAGNHTNGVTSQESALLSAVEVARRISPDSARLRSLLAGQ
ncbi:MULTISPECIES: FAD-dependent oxidoreductase [Actinomadura]|uniref:FAD-dependent oxidoreductase n=1 Tax=Actinomadura yumaensis TaxID=111807 RepID=A0ABW2CM75_9ACTN|nr:FAD-dependent oxidoreductase [Actinomadura sp. J1-007]MWK36918.1 NAD(P)-binding protein [Actinomadura sp. J1-007]